MRRVRYQVACSLDGYIAGPNDEFDWITPEPLFDFEALFAEFDTLLMGRRSFEIVRATGENFILWILFNLRLYRFFSVEGCNCSLHMVCVDNWH